MYIYTDKDGTTLQPKKSVLQYQHNSNTTDFSGWSVVPLCSILVGSPVVFLLENVD